MDYMQTMIDMRRLMRMHAAKSTTITLFQQCPGGLEHSALGQWAQRKDGLMRACPVVVILVVPPLRRQAFLVHFHHCCGKVDAISSDESCASMDINNAWHATYASAIVEAQKQSLTAGG